MLPARNYLVRRCVSRWRLITTDHEMVGLMVGWFIVCCASGHAQSHWREEEWCHHVIWERRGILSIEATEAKYQHKEFNWCRTGLCWWYDANDTLDTSVHGTAGLHYDNNIIYHDNQSTMLLEKNGQQSKHQENMPPREQAIWTYNISLLLIESGTSSWQLSTVQLAICGLTFMQSHFRGQHLLSFANFLWTCRTIWVWLQGGNEQQMASTLAALPFAHRSVLKIIEGHVTWK